MQVITKSKFISGCQCAKKLYFDFYRSDLKPVLEAAQERLLNSGTSIGHLARTRFPCGIDVTEDMDGDWKIAIDKTMAMLKNRNGTIYEAVFSKSKAFAALDILHFTDSECWAIEVKSSASLKDYHILDASLQYWVMNECGCAPDKFFIMHINSQYVRNGHIDPFSLFIMQDVTEQVLMNQQWVKDRLIEFHEILLQQKEPAIQIGKHCNVPFACDYIKHCWSDVPENSVFDLINPRGIDWSLYGRGIMELKNIPDDENLNFRQKLQVNGIRNNDGYFDWVSVNDFMSKMVFPLYFFDFETVFPAIPPINGARPFQQTPFQYSLHIWNSPESPIYHRAFLADPDDFQPHSKNDPRELMLNQLFNDIGKEGTIIAYNASFEINVLKSLIPLYPNYSHQIEDLCNRFVDLLIPFKNGWYYLPSMGKSASIKSVLPSLDPEFSYRDLVIGNGSDASDVFLSMINQQYSGNIQEMRGHLLNYCERDTYGMVVIFKNIQNKLIESN
jgi:hypothetical protein